MSKRYAYVNDSFIEENNANIPITNRGFLFGDGFFETIRFEDRKACFLEYHIERMEFALKDLLIDNIDILQNIPKIVEQTISLNPLDNGLLRITITRNSESMGYLPKDINNASIVVTIRDLPTSNSLDAIDLYVSSFAYCGVNKYKSLNAKPYILSKIEAVKNSCLDGLLINKDGYVCETSSANIFWFKNGKLYTPCLSLGIVSGIIRRRIIEINIYPVNTGKYTINDIKESQLVFITNTARMLTPVKTIIYKENNFRLPHEDMNFIAQDILRALAS